MLVCLILLWQILKYLHILSLAITSNGLSQLVLLLLSDVSVLHPSPAKSYDFICGVEIM